MQYKLENEALNSRRGKYQVASLEANPIIWTPDLISARIPRHKDVIEEVDYAVNERLHLHKYWFDEPDYFIKEYQSFYRKLFSLSWLHRKEDRHNIVVNENCCLTLVQYHNGNLIAYSRSTDMRNGYFSDKILLNYLAMQIGVWRPDCKVDKIIWYMAIPHVYEEKGIARLLETDEVKE